MALKPLYFGFALDPVKESLLAVTVRDNYHDAVAETAELAGNLLQKVIPSATIARDLFDWLIGAGISKREAKHLLKVFASNLKRPATCKVRPE